MGRIMKRYYFAHSWDAKEYILRIEKELEAELGIELINPFYDFDNPGTKLLEKLDAEDETWKIELDAIKIVELDLSKIESLDGVVAYIKREYSTIGTVIESWEAARHMGKPVFIISPDAYNHPWLRYLTKKHGAIIFKDFDEFKKFMREEVIVESK